MSKLFVVNVTMRKVILQLYIEYVRGVKVSILVLFFKLYSIPDIAHSEQYIVWDKPLVVSVQ